MPTRDLASLYRTKTDEELLQLAMDAEQLTPEAHSALTSELAKRRIDGAEHLKVQPKRCQKPRNAVQFLSQSPGVGEFVTEVLRVYHAQFWFFVRLIAPAVVVGYIAITMARNEGREIARQLPRGVGMLGHQAEILKIGLANFVGYVVSWTAFSFSFGAICSGVCQIEAGVVPSVPDSLAAVRQRMGSFLRLSLLLFFLLFVAEAVAGLLGAGALWVLHQRLLHLSGFTIRAVSFGFASVALLLFSRFGLAIPALILDDCGFGHAMFLSDELTEGKWLTLAVLLIKSVIGGYIAGMLPFWLASWIRASTPLPP